MLALSTIFRIGKAGNPMAQYSVYPLVLAISIYLIPTLAFAQSNAEIESAARQYISNHASLWMEDPVIVDELNAQNQSNAGLSQGDDESSQRFQVQVSVSIVDPANGKTIGAITIGIDAEGLLMM